MDAPSVRPRPTTPELFVVVASVAATAVLSLRGLARRSFWLDEGVSAFAATGPISRLVGHAQSEPNFGLYYVLLRGWSVFGTSEFTFRLLSVVLAVLTVPVVYATARRLWDGWIAATAAVLFSVNGFILGYAQEARPYALVVFASALATLLLLRAIDQPERFSRWVAWAIAAAFTMLAHTFGASIVVAHVIVLVVRRESVPVRTIVKAAALPAGVLVLFGIAMLRAGNQRVGWIPTVSPDRLAVVAYTTAGGRNAWLFAGYAIALVVLVVVIVRATDERRRRLLYGAAVGACLLVTPFLVALIATPVQSLFEPRYFIVCVPPLVVLVAAGVGQLRPAIAALAVVVLVVCSMPTALSPWRGSRDEDWRGAVALVEPTASPDDLVVVARFGVLGLRYYLERSGPPDRMPSSVSSEGFLDGRNVLLHPCHLQRVWVIVEQKAAGDDVGRELAPSHEPVEVVQLAGVRVTRFERRASAGPAVTRGQPCP
jgi:mannosyltransferase